MDAPTDEEIKAEEYERQHTSDNMAGVVNNSLLTLDINCNLYEVCPHCTGALLIDVMFGALADDRPKMAQEIYDKLGEKLPAVTPTEETVH